MSDAQSGNSDTQAMAREIRRLQGRVDELEDFLEHAAEGLHMVGPDGTILWANQEELAMLGYLREEYVGRRIHEFHVDAPVLEDFLDRLKRGETFHSLPARLRSRDGTIRHVVVSSNGLFRDGEFVCTRCMTRDVSRERAAEEGLAQLAAIVESTDDAVIGKDVQGVVTSWNPGAERIHGHRADEMIGASILKIVPPELHGEEREILARIAAGERITHYETVWLAKSGARVNVSLTVSPIRDPGGRVIGASAIARDISQRIDADRRKDEFLAILAHELRNPLAPVRNALMLLRTPGAAAEQRSKALGIAERQTQHMARLLDDLLDVARITSGHVPLRKQTFALQPVLLHAVDAIRSYAEAKNQRIVVDLQADRLQMHGDPVRIQQVVANLLHNAVKYSDSGGNIALTCRPGGGLATIAVRDDGIGFGPELHGKLFTLFTQADASAHRAAGGLGIGLALVREFVERHGGSVEARSDGPMRGSEFIVRIPCEELASPPAEAREDAAAA